MENAGLKSVVLLKEQLWGGTVPPGIVFVCGKGNNGGDALVMARQCLMDGATDLTVVLAAGEPKAGSDPAVNLSLCRALGIKILALEQERSEVMAAIHCARWLVDGVAGTGLEGPLRAPLDGVVAAMNESRAYTIAVDVPSGVGDGFRAGFPAVRAGLTLTMGLPKQCLYLPHARPLCGKIVVVPLGFPPALTEDPTIPGQILEEGDYTRLFPEIPAEAHKNRRGHLAVFAGSPGTTGAAWLCATAAARARTGLVTVFLGPEEYAVLAGKFSSVMVRPWDSARWDPADWSRYSALLVGPGWGRSEQRAQWLRRLLTLGLPGVIDADGLSLIGTETVNLAGWVLTPHPGEFAVLSGVARDKILEDPVAHALAVSRKLNAVVALKGACTCIAEPQGQFWIYDGMNAALGTGGSGDVLSGIIAAGLSQGMTPLEAALAGVSLHGRIGRIARSRKGWFLAEDMLPLISKVLGHGR